MTDSNQLSHLALDQPGSAGPNMRRFGIGLALVVIVATLVAMHFRQIPLAQYPQFATVHASFIFVVDGVVAYLLFGQLAYRRLMSYALLGSAYLFNALAVMPFLLSFPVALVSGANQSAIWLGQAWHIVFPITVALALLVHERDGEHTIPPRRVGAVILLSVSITLAMALLLTMAIGVSHDDSPVPIAADHAPLARAVAAAVTALALALALWGARRRAALHAWLALTMLLMLSDVVVNLAAPARFTLGWYFAQAGSMIAVAVLLLVFLGEIGRLYRRLGMAYSQLQGRETEIRQMAYFDPLTNLPNRRLLMDRLIHDLAQSKRHGHPIALLFLDLDKFKQVNDKLGHDAGDKLLQEVALRISASVRGGDTVSRLAGDEFVIVLPEIAHERDAKATAEKLIDAIGEPMMLAGRQLRITASIGIAIVGPGSRHDAMQLLAQADAAMYGAKNAGRNQYVLAVETTS